MTPGRRFLLLASLVAGCAASGPPPLLLTLPSNAVPLAPAMVETATGPLLVLRRVGIPEYLTTRRVRYRADASTLAEWPDTFWAERIEVGVSREFAAALRGELPGWRLCDANCGGAVPGLALQVELAPMDYLRPAHELRARAHIGVSRGGANASVLQDREASFTVPVASDTPQGHAEALATLLRQVAAFAAPLVRAAPR